MTNPSEPSKEAMEILDFHHLPVGNRLEFQDLVVMSRRLAAKAIDTLREKDRAAYKAKVADLEEERDKLKAENERLLRALNAVRKLGDSHVSATNFNPPQSEEYVLGYRNGRSAACASARHEIFRLEALTQSPDYKDQWPTDRRVFAEDEA